MKRQIESSAEEKLSRDFVLNREVEFFASCRCIKVIHRINIHPVIEGTREII